MEQKTPEELQKHMLGTYFSLRVGMAVIAFALPTVVALTGKVLHGEGLKGSLSAYYYRHGQAPYFTTRELFVGGLFAAAACLYLYKGYSTKENVALNLAGLFAAMVALLPTSAPKEVVDLLAKTPPEYAAAFPTVIDKSDHWFGYMHGTMAVLFFLCIAYVSLRRARDTVGLLPPGDQTRFRHYYGLTSAALVLSPLAAVVLSFLTDPSTSTWLFWAETTAVWSFGAYWAIKTLEMRSSQAERRGLDAELEREVVTSGGAGAGVGAAPEMAPRGAGGKEKIVPAGTPTAR